MAVSVVFTKQEILLLAFKRSPSRNQVSVTLGSDASSRVLLTEQ